MWGKTKEKHNAGEGKGSVGENLQFRGDTWVLAWRRKGTCKAGTCRKSVLGKYKVSNAERLKGITEIEKPWVWDSIET